MCPSTTATNSATAVDREALLIRRVVSGEAHLFRDLVGPHLPRLLAFTQNRLGSKPDAEDVVQEATLKAFRHLADFRFESHFSTWFFHIISNVIQQFWRRKRRAARFENGRASYEDVLRESGSRDPGPSPLELLEREEVIERLHNSIQRLPKSQRAVIVLRGIEELSTDDVARKLNLTDSVVRTRFFRARLKLLDLVRTEATST